MDNTLVLAFLGHMVGDYLLQNDWMALNKKLRSWPCLVHCLLWTASVCLFAGWTASPLPFTVLFAFHFLQDRTHLVRWLMLHCGQPGFTQSPFAPWSLIVVDNTWHLLQIWLVWRLLS